MKNKIIFYNVNFQSALNAMQANNEVFMQKPLRVDFADQKTVFIFPD